MGLFASEPRAVCDMDPDDAVVWVVNMSCASQRQDSSGGSGDSTAPCTRDRDEELLPSMPRRRMRYLDLYFCTCVAKPVTLSSFPRDWYAVVLVQQEGFGCVVRLASGFDGSKDTPAPPETCPAAPANPPTSATRSTSWPVLPPLRLEPPDRTAQRSGCRWLLVFRGCPDG